MEFFGKYRGMVIATDDPHKLGRLKVVVPNIGSAEMWAMPCLPYAATTGAIEAFPPVGTHVWVEFESGDHTLPIWTGCFWT